MTYIYLLTDLETGEIRGKDDQYVSLEYAKKAAEEEAAKGFSTNLVFTIFSVNGAILKQVAKAVVPSKLNWNDK